MTRYVGKLHDSTFPHRKTGTPCRRYYLKLPPKLIDDPKFPLKLDAEVLISIDEKNKRLVLETM